MSFILAFTTESPILVSGDEQCASGFSAVPIAIIIAGFGLIGLVFCLWLGMKKYGKTS